MAPGKCTGQTIRIDRLEKAVLTNIQTMVNVSVEYETLVEQIRHSEQRKTESSHLLRTLDDSIAKLRQTAGQYAGCMEQENEFLAHFRKYRNFTELTRPMLTELVREIRIYGGGRLEIILNFRDELQALTNYLDMNREALESSAQ